MHITLEQLNNFIAVFELNSFTKAAELLNKTQPSVTLNIKSLEEQMDVSLFDRSHNRIIPTIAGVNFYTEAKKVIKQVDSLKQVMLSLNGFVKVLRVVISDTISTHLVNELHEVISEVYANDTTVLKHELYQPNMLVGESFMLYVTLINKRPKGLEQLKYKSVLKGKTDRELDVYIWSNI